MINKVILLGRLGKDPVVRRLDNGRVVANVTLATNDYYTKDGQRLESTEWHNLEMWDKQAETAEKYLKKRKFVVCGGEDSDRSLYRCGRTGTSDSQDSCQQFPDDGVIVGFAQ